MTHELLRLLDDLETTAEPALTLAEAERAAGRNLADLVSEGVLLVDYRQRLLADGQVAPITLCRLNRHHPRVRALNDWS